MHYIETSIDYNVALLLYLAINYKYRCKMIDPIFYHSPLMATLPESIHFEFAVLSIGSDDANVSLVLTISLEKSKSFRHTIKP